MICYIIIANGRTGETRFAPHEQQRNNSLKQRALSELYTSEILEWYRQQYNIPLSTFYEQNVDEDIAFVDFYRRQYWNELRFGIRDWGDESPELKMPQFTLFRPFGGVLPAPNGFDFDNTYTSKIEHFNMGGSSNKKAEATTSDGPDTYTLEKTSSKPKTGVPYESEEATYRMPIKEFDKMMESMQNDDSFWEQLEELGSMTNG
jgi:hypothetical protein